MTDNTHLEAHKEHLVILMTQLSNEKIRLDKATKQSEISLRTVWVSQIEKEITNLMQFLGIEETVSITLSDDELLAELEA